MDPAGGATQHLLSLTGGNRLPDRVEDCVATAIELPIVVGVGVVGRECEQRRRVSRWDDAIMPVGVPPSGPNVEHVLIATW